MIELNFTKKLVYYIAIECLHELPHGNFIHHVIYVGVLNTNDNGITYSIKWVRSFIFIVLATTLCDSGELT